jgi:hypothetical protein
MGDVPSQHLMCPVPFAGRRRQGHPAGGAPAGSASEQCARARQRTVLSLLQEASPARRRYTDLGRQDIRGLPQQQIFIVPSVIFSMSLGPHVGAQCLCACPPSAIKGEACDVTGDPEPISDSQYITQWSRVLRPEARTTLNPRVLIHQPRNKQDA